MARFSTTCFILLASLAFFNVINCTDTILSKTPVEGSRFTREEVRVSWKECNLNESARHDCGFYGVSEEQCYSRECCWGESETEGVPWCYHSKPTVKTNCEANPAEKVECGFYGIRKEQCLALECCWQPSSVQEAPWCYHTIRVPVYEGECGVPAIPPQVLSRVVGGDEAVPHSWPWQASLQVDGRQNCGGSLINNQWIVTAAHCAGGLLRANSSIKLGLHSLSEKDPLQQSFGYSELIKHEVFGTEGFYGLSADIMVVKLDRPVEFNDHISPVCLAEPDTDLEAGRYAYVTGWGLTKDRGLGGEIPDKLQQVRTPIMSNEQCNSYEGYEDNVDPTMMCTGFEEGGKAFCRGDSGGPLVVNEDGHWTMIGVVSWTILCAGSRDPEVYCRVSEFTEWIEQTIAEHGG